MVRSKFPGKPSKIVQRSLVKAYSVVVPSFDTSTLSEDVYYGLNVFELTFGSENEDVNFTGFDHADIETSYKRKEQCYSELQGEYLKGGLTYSSSCVSGRFPVPINLQGYIKKFPKKQLEKIDSGTLPNRKNDCIKRSKVWLLNKRGINRYHPKIPMRHGFKTISKNSLIRFKHKSSNYLSEKYCRKFVLPSHSLHSSRIIKPNKRFIDAERSSKSKLIFKSGSSLTSNTSLRSGHVDIDSSNCYQKKSLNVSPSNKVIIREARLNIISEPVMAGPFSSKRNVSFEKEKFRSGIITCGICGATRFYKYVLQTKKFGIHSCEPCRRFILRMIKQSKLQHHEILKCKTENGAGRCVIPAIARTKISDENILSKCSRCPVCWLILCLERYVMPSSVRKLLIKMIPDDMKALSTCGTPDGGRKSQCGTDDSCSGNGEAENADPLKKRLNERCFSNAIVHFKKVSEKTEIQPVKSKLLFFKKTSLNQKLNSKYKRFSENTVNENTEKIHFTSRGPRIKHVCRSASSVLKMSAIESGDYEADDFNDGFQECDSENSTQNNYEKENQCDEEHCAGETSDKSNHIGLTSQQYGARSLQDFYKESANEFDENEDKLISVDFWEAYDPDEIYKTGFPLICSESMHVRAVCFLCGSVGLEKLLYCVCCCEPYHWYCAEGPSAFREETELENCRVSWVCRKCKVCSVCGERKAGSLISCQRCRHSYHTECLSNKALNKRLFKSDRPWVCPTCLKCKSCNGSSVFTFVGNVPLCSLCFKLRQKGNYCPLCQGCYMDEDYNVQMMECGSCKCWIHAKCEGISSEKYQILSFLPESVEFICRLCCTTPPAPWWLAVEDELKTRYLEILKCLCKHKDVSDLVKESPKKDSGCTCRKRRSDFEIEECVTGPSFNRVDKREITSPVHEQRQQSSEENGYCETDNTKCHNSETNFHQIDYCSCYTGTKMKIYRNLLAVKTNVHNNQYSTVSSFYLELKNVIAPMEEPLLLKTCHEIVKQFFPWFDPERVPLEESPENISEFQVNDNSLQNEHMTENVFANDDYATLKKLFAEDEYRYENFRMLDVRTCNFCKEMGEAKPCEGGRLIYCGRDEWVHSNCALWSSEVYEEIDGSLQNVQSALSRGRQMRCSVCDKKGASVGCCYKACGVTYHFACAKRARCNFFQNKSVYCRIHDMSDITLPLLTNEKDFEILRPVYVENDRKKKKFEWHANVKLRIGSLNVESLGKIDPHLSDKPKHIIPIYFRCTRLFWSTAKPWKLIQYHIQIKVSYSCQKMAAESDINYTIDHSSRDEIVHRVVQQLVRQVEENCEPVKSDWQENKDDACIGDDNGRYYNETCLTSDDDSFGKVQENYKQLMSNSHGVTSKPRGRYDEPGEVTKLHSNERNGCATTVDFKKVQTESARINSKILSKKKTSLNGSLDCVSSNCLRDRNETSLAVSVKKNCFGVNNMNTSVGKTMKFKRKLDFENSVMLAKKKMFVNDYIAASKLDNVLKYYSTFKNIMQVDGMVDMFSEEEPVKCVQCHRTYRNTLSFQRHLETCTTDFGDYMISSCESDSTSSEEEKISYVNVDTVPGIVSSSQQNFENAYVLENNEKVNPQPFCANNLCFNANYNENVHPSYAGGMSIATITNTGPVASTVPATENLIVDGLNQTASVQTILQNFKSNSFPVQPIVTPTDVNGKYVSIGNKSCIDYTTNYALTDTCGIQTFDIQNVAAPTAFVIQSFPKTEVVPTYIAIADGTTVADCNMHIAETYLSQPLHVPQMTNAISQPASINFQPIIPSIAIVQPNVVEPPTYVVNTSTGPPVMAPTVMAELFSSPQDGIILANQPPLLGLETIVSNTIMASSQYMAQSLGGGVGSSTMYSSTTTQVFQAAAKPLPQPDFPPSFIVLNSAALTPAATMQANVQPKLYQSSSSFQPNNFEKCMYVQINSAQQPQQSVNTRKPVIVKPVKRNVPNIKKNVAKVIKVKNNRPVEVKHGEIAVSCASTQASIQNASYSVPLVDQSNKSGLQIEITNQSLKNRNGMLNIGDVKRASSPSFTAALNPPVIIKSQESLPEDERKCCCDKKVAIVVPESQPKIGTNEPCIVVPPSSTDKPEIVVKGSSVISQTVPDKDKNVVKTTPLPELFPSFSRLSPSFSTPKPSVSLSMVQAEIVDSQFPSSDTKRAVGETYINSSLSNDHIKPSTSSPSATKVTVNREMWSESLVNECANNTAESRLSHPKPNNSIKNDEIVKKIVISNVPRKIEMKKVFSPQLPSLSPPLSSLLPQLPSLPPQLPSLSPPLPVATAEEVKNDGSAKRSRTSSDELFDRLLTLPDRQVKANRKNVEVSTSPATNILSNFTQVSQQLEDETKLLQDQQTTEIVVSDQILLTPITPNNLSASPEDEIVLSKQNTSSSDSVKIQEPSDEFMSKTLQKNKYKPNVQRCKPLWGNKLVNNGEMMNSSKKTRSPEKENNGRKREDSLLDTSNGNNWKTASISYEVNAEDGFSYKTNSLLDLWNKILESVQQSRVKYKLPLLPKNASMNAESVYSLLGFENNASKYLLEQLPDAWKCIFYKPAFHKSTIQNGKTSPTESESGCARTEPFTSKHKFDMFGWLASRHRKPPKFMMVSDSDIVNGNRRVTSLNLPMAMRFRHLKETAKETVGVFRSDIHGRGLFCLRDIDAGEMVIEYAGEVIRSTLTDKREKNYTSKGIGCYMFRIDDHYVVDATMCGNAARFINHSCEPNCYSRIVDILGKKHILIFALRRIPKGEELTYDYKFPLEDEKIYCHCLSRKCRKYLN